LNEPIALPPSRSSPSTITLISPSEVSSAPRTWMIFSVSRLPAVPPMAALGDAFVICDASSCSNLHLPLTSGGACESAVYSGVSTETSALPGFFVPPHSPARPRIAANTQRMRGS
jgi:hypothetical protein